MDYVMRRLVGRSKRTRGRRVRPTRPQGRSSRQHAPFDVEVHLTPPFSRLRGAPD
jgi:hypothetical protein